MVKIQLMLSLDSEVVKALRLAAMEKYGNTKSASRYIEDLVKEATRRGD
jgi:hypothetical protein